MTDRLFNGSDLSVAVARSQVSSDRNGRLAGHRNAFGVLADTLARRSTRRGPGTLHLVTARAGAPGGETLVAGYVGFGHNEDWCLSSALGTDRETLVSEQLSSRRVTPQLEDLTARANVIFFDGVRPPRAIRRVLALLEMPAWVKQRLPVSRDWSAQLDLLRRGTRQEVARILRKYGYDCRLSDDRRDFEHFYQTLYQPYVRQRFGKGAIAVDFERFLAECRRGVVLQLLSDGVVVGAALLRRVGNTMAIVWSAVDPGRQDTARGAADVMDYFSLLYAYLKGCRWLDFGPSRPDLNDGIVRYKSKWGAEITRGLVRQAPIWLGCTGKSGAECEFLRQHAFLVRDGRSLAATVFVDGPTATPDLNAVLEKLRTPGIDAYRVIALPPADGSLASAVAGSGQRIRMSGASSVRQALAATR